MSDEPTLPEKDERTLPTWVVKEKVNTNPHYLYQKDGGIVDLNRAQKLEALTKARLHSPEAKNLKKVIYEEVKGIIDRDPFLKYENETDSIYQVIDSALEVLVVPKERAVPEPFPVPWPDSIRKAYRFLMGAFLGLILSGLGAVLLAPAAGFIALLAAFKEPKPENRARARFILLLSMIVFVVGIDLVYLLWIHIF